MEALKSLEMSLVKATKDLPHLPKGLTTWLVENAWWLVLIGVVIGVIAVFPLIGAVMFIGGVSSLYLGVGYSGLYLVSSWISLAVLAATIVIEGMAIQPLKEKQKRGWNLLFAASLLGIVGSLVSALIMGNIFGGIVSAAIVAAISLYVLFELRPHYVGGAAKVTSPKPVVK
ncbi:MAG: hypothetical protein WBO49_03755 [Candidatus Saccharimonas sp.]